MIILRHSSEINKASTSKIDFMSKKGITNSILTILMFIVMAFVVIDCQADAGSMNGSQSIYFGNLHWTQILLSLGAGLIIGFILALVISKRIR